jgi:hypothetical protein
LIGWGVEPTVNAAAAAVTLRERQLALPTKQDVRLGMKAATAIVCVFCAVENKGSVVEKMAG